MNNILIVDDETPIREWIDICIREYPGVGGTYVSRNGEEAIRLLETEDVDIVLTDITMPKLNGLQLLAYIRNNYPDITVVIMSVHSEFEYARIALKQGAFDYILKNEITKDSIFQILDKIRADRSINEPQKGSDESILAQIIRSKYLQHLLISGNFSGDMEELVKNKIYIENRFLFAVAMPDCPEKIVQMKLYKNEALSSVTFFTYGKNKLLFMANIQKEDNAYVKELCGHIQRLAEGNVGYSMVCFGVGCFLKAAREAIAMREALFYSPDLTGAACNQDKSDEKRCKTEIEAMQNEIVEAFTANRRKKAIAEFNAMINHIAFIRLEDVDFVKNCISMTAHRIYNNSKAMDIDIKKFEDQIQHCKNIQEVRLLLQEFYSKMETEGRYSSSVLNAMEFIENNYMNQISLAGVAETIFLNEEYFSRLFKKEAGINFTDYLTAIRMKQAKRLITTTDIKISVVADMVGISNHKYFSLLFKKHFDTTPSQMRGEQ